MSTVTAKRAPVKPTLTFSLAGDLLSITEATSRRSETHDYTVRRLDSAWGQAFELTKVGQFGDTDENVYHVLVENEQDHDCSCKGFIRWGRCRHASAVLALVEEGRLS